MSLWQTQALACTFHFQEFVTNTSAGLHVSGVWDKHKCWLACFRSLDKHKCWLACFRSLRWTQMLTYMFQEFVTNTSIGLHVLGMWWTQALACMFQGSVMNTNAGLHVSGVCNKHKGWLVCFRSLWWAQMLACMFQELVTNTNADLHVLGICDNTPSG